VICIYSNLVSCRWDETAVSLLPEYMKDFYMYLLKTFSSFENELGPDKSYRVFYLKEAASFYFYLP
jgi:(S)-beta-macrocarpene synthase